ncbi:DUF4025 domain-containing protein [Peribacillus saganii]|uniref:DUF4025 domain-containing protein n=1 Tax=Peribacillus saganii TaxID=2303992 RepID=A0A372LQY9_9BACI|nr:YozQ family protein [Peribacillus saganii]RFU70466.1 DUF4025 domain-containing protein [Peribacillus saganii]
MKRDDTENSLKIAGRTYNSEDYYKDDEVSIGLATTHEQVSDHFMGGEAVPPDPNDTPPIPRKSSEK